MIMKQPRAEGCFLALRKSRAAMTCRPVGSRREALPRAGTGRRCRGRVQGGAAATAAPRIGTGTLADRLSRGRQRLERPAIADIARRADVTKAAVSFALNGQPVPGPGVRRGVWPGGLLNRTDMGSRP